MSSQGIVDIGEDSSTTGLGWVVKLSRAKAVVGEWRDNERPELVARIEAGRRATDAAVGDGGLSRLKVLGFLELGNGDVFDSRSNCSNSNNCPRKLKFGEIVGRLSLTYLQTAHNKRTFIQYE